MFVQTKVLLRGSLRRRKSRRRVRDENDSHYDYSVEIERMEPSGVMAASDVKKAVEQSSSGASDPKDPWFQIHKELPAATRSECRRFWAAHEANPKLVRDHLKGYLQFRKIHNLDVKGRSAELSAALVLEERQQDKEDWEQAWEMTWKQAARPEGLFPDDPSNNHKKQNKQHHQEVSYKKTTIPQYIHAYKGPKTTNNNGPIIFQVMAAQMDIKVASPEHHTLAVALYFDRKFSRFSDDDDDDHQQGNLWMDVRGAPGWANPSPWQLYPIVSTFAHHLLRLHPERLNQLVIFPLPGWAVAILKMVLKILPAVVQQRMICVAGSEKLNVPLPIDKMAEKGRVSPELIREMERTRKQAIIIKEEEASQ